MRKPNLDAYFNVDFGFEDVPVPLGIFPPFEREVNKEEGQFYLERDERGILMRRRREKGSMPGFLEHPVKGWDDWEKIKMERLDPNHPGRYLIDLAAFKGYLEITGSVATLGSYPYGVFGTPRDLMGAEPLFVAFIDRPDLIHDMMDYLTDFWVGMYDRVTERLNVACIHLWEDMAGL